jgi:hypothetical protein
MVWAVHRTIALLGNGLPDATADRKVILRSPRSPRPWPV